MQTRRERLKQALDELEAERIAVPPFAAEYLERGLAVHFRCQSLEARGMRVDVMSKMRGVEDFSELWKRRTTLEIEGETFEILSLRDLVQAKKTQRDKDWPMLTRLIDGHYAANRAAPTEAQIEFWLREMRSPTLLIEVASRFPENLQPVAASRPLLERARAKDETSLRKGLREEEE